MKLDVPFYRQTTKLNCGPSALRMVISYFDKDVGIKILEEKTGIKKGKGLSTIQIAIAAGLLGYNVDFYSIHLTFNQENLKLDFVKKYHDTEIVTEDLVRIARNIGVNLNEKSVPLEELLSFINQDSIPIVLLDWNIINKKEGYRGHFVPVVGYDNRNVYVHNHGFNKPKKFLAIKRDTFERARKAKGTDEDIVVIHRK
ncbi:peptidase C39 family protein [Candidatus Pacearchaeota archaeon]|nr:peptidase C39 family protein [Candidatus Pacearchaeota archaeon]